MAAAEPEAGKSIRPSAASWPAAAAAAAKPSMAAKTAARVRASAIEPSRRRILRRRAEKTFGGVSIPASPFDFRVKETKSCATCF